MSLTCSLIYTPIKDESWNETLKHPNYICSDHRVHIRFKDYNEIQLVKGFENKLTYLISYLMNFSYLPTVIQKYDYNVLITDFLNTSDINKILVAINLFSQDLKFRGLKLAKSYRKDASKQSNFGNVDINCFPLDREDSSVQKYGSLEAFLNYFHNIDLNEYLFNDAICILIHENKHDKLNKFEKKELKKTQITENSQLVEIDLW